jgi:hypothetical protein
MISLDTSQIAKYPQHVCATQHAFQRLASRLLPHLTLAAG